MKKKKIRLNVAKVKQKFRKAYLTSFCDVSGNCLPKDFIQYLEIRSSKFLP